MAAIAGVGVYNGSVGFVKVIVAAKNPVALFRYSGKGRAGDAGLFDLQRDHPLTNAARDKGDQLFVAGSAARFQKLIKVVVTGNSNLINVAIPVVVVGRGYFLDRGKGQNFVPPQAAYGHNGQQHHTGQNNACNLPYFLHSSIPSFLDWPAHAFGEALSSRCLTYCSRLLRIT